MHKERDSEVEARVLRSCGGCKVVLLRQPMNRCVCSATRAGVVQGRDIAVGMRCGLPFEYVALELCGLCHPISWQGDAYAYCHPRDRKHLETIQTCEEESRGLVQCLFPGSPDKR